MDTKESKKNPEKVMNRRNFISATSAIAAGLCLPGMAGCSKKAFDKMLRKHFLELSPQQVQEMLRDLEKENEEKYSKPGIIEATPAMKGVNFAYALDISRCIGCRRCVHACVQENNQSRDPMIEWIRVLEFKKESGIDFAEADPYYCSPASVHGDERTPEEQKAHPPAPYVAKIDATQMAILKNPNSQYPLYRPPTMAPADSPCSVPRPGHFYVPVACQQCEDPPCVKVCPAKATWKEEDGIVVIDYDWCIGCRYCMGACPYGARHFNWSEPVLPSEELNPKMHYLGNRPRMKGVVEKCTFCIHRTRKGLYPACVDICPVGSRKFGNLLDPHSEIRYILEHKRVLILKNELATRPKFFYFYGI